MRASSKCHAIVYFPLIGEIQTLPGEQTSRTQNQANLQQKEKDRRKDIDTGFCMDYSRPLGSTFHDLLTFSRSHL